ncbi:MAG: HPr family phosphocarrier protein [Xylanivirga thermophila]|uniref:HPr family phosphocarrier protein n=1 Tax=Xylanivirga thermophila TaxID=2496273 RepID=UPI00101BFBA9|nr:HPr family phosphocarrier protein [Xylanivirga thermophila]
MVQSVVKITHQSGLRARPAALFVQIASKFSSNIWIQKDAKKINAKSIMGVMSLGVAQGDEITLKIEGKDEKEAMDAMKKLINSNFADMPEVNSKATK